MNKKDNLEKIKNAATGIAGGATMVAAIFNHNPILAIGGATAFFGSIISPTINAWRNQWFEDLHNDFKKLEEKFEKFNLQKKLKDPKVINIILEATSAAIKTGEKKKHEILRNAVLNISLDVKSKDDEQHLILNTISQLTPSHVIILKELLNQDKLREDRHIFCKPTDSFLIKHKLLPSYMAFLTNLENLGLITVDRSYIHPVGKTVIHPAKVNSFGEKILKCIENPIQDS